MNSDQLLQVITAVHQTNITVAYQQAQEALAALTASPDAHQQTTP